MLFFGPTSHLHGHEYPNVLSLPNSTFFSFPSTLYSSSLVSPPLLQFPHPFIPNSSFSPVSYLFPAYSLALSLPSSPDPLPPLTHLSSPRLLHLSVTFWRPDAPRVRDMTEFAFDAADSLHAALVFTLSALSLSAPLTPLLALLSAPPTPPHPRRRALFKDTNQ